MASKDQEALTASLYSWNRLRDDLCLPEAHAYWLIYSSNSQGEQLTPFLGGRLAPKSPNVRWCDLGCDLLPPCMRYSSVSSSAAGVDSLFSFCLVLLSACSVFFDFGPFSRIALRRPIRKLQEVPRPRPGGFFFVLPLCEAFNDTDGSVHGAQCLVGMLEDDAWLFAPHSRAGF